MASPPPRTPHRVRPRWSTASYVLQPRSAGQLDARARQRWTSFLGRSRPCAARATVIVDGAFILVTSRGRASRVGRAVSHPGASRLRPRRGPPARPGARVRAAGEEESPLLRTAGVNASRRSTSRTCTRRRRCDTGARDQRVPAPCGRGVLGWRAPRPSALSDVEALPAFRLAPVDVEVVEWSDPTPGPSPRRTRY